MENTPIRQLVRNCLMFGLVLSPFISPITQLAAQDEPKVASRSPLQFGKNYWPSRPATTTGKDTSATQQPGIFRGGLVQQLRSITSSVLGESESAEATVDGELDGGSESANIPSPPSLKDVIDAPAYTDDAESYMEEEMEADMEASIPDAPEFDTPAPRTTQPRVTAPPVRPKMPEPAVPGQSRWRNQSQKPTPLGDAPSLSTNQYDRSTPRAVPVTPRATNPNSRSNNAPVPPSNAASSSGRRVVPNNGSVPSPPSTSTSRSTQTANESETKPSTVAVQPSKTNSSRRMNGSTDKLNTNEITLPTTQVTELDENRVKLSDRAPVGSAPSSSGSEDAPLVSKKLPPGRPKSSSEATGTTIPAPQVLTSTPNTKTNSEPTKSDSSTSPAELVLESKSTPDATLNSNKGVSLSNPEMKSNQSDATTAAVGAPSQPQNKSLDMEIPSVLVRLAGPSDIPVGRKGEYELIAKNTGTIPLNGAIVRMDVPKGVTSEIDETLKAQTESETLEDGSLAIVWQVSELAAGQSQKLPIKLTAAEAKNFAIAMEWTVMPQNGELLVNVQKPDLQIGLEGPAEVSFGVPQIYRLKISNPGTAPAENVVLNLSAEPYGANSSPIGTIAPGTNRVVEVELTFQQKGKLKIKAEAVGDNLKSAAEVDVIVHQAMLAATVSGIESEYVGATVDYKMELTNSGDAASENVIAQVELPEGVKLVQLPTGARLSGKILLWEINSLNAGQSLTFNWQVELLSAGEKLFQATCRGSAGGSAVAQTKTVVDAVADLKLTLSDPPSPSPVGEEVVYELEIMNRGKQAANKVKVLAQFSEGIEPSGAVGAEHKLVPGQVLFEPIPAIGAGETVKLQVRALASEAGVHRFRIEVQTDDEEIHHVLEESTRYMQTAARPTGTKLR